MTMPIRRLAAAAGLLLAALTAAPVEAGTLDAVRARGKLLCGTLGNVPGFSAPDSKGVIQGLNADFCRAVAAAVFGDGSKVDFVTVTPTTRFASLQAGDVDVLFSNTTWTFTRDTSQNALFGPVVFYDGQKILVPRKLGVTSIRQLDGASICITPGSSTEAVTLDYFRAAGITYKPIALENAEAIRTAFFAGRCDGFVADASYLAANRSLAPNPDDYVLLPETINKSPIGVVLRQGDDAWFQLVKWVVLITINAEEKGVTRANVEARAAEGNPSVDRLLKPNENLAKPLGLNADWVQTVIRTVGNYGEIYDRNFGPQTPVALPRGYNKLWNDGGLQFAPLYP